MKLGHKTNGIFKVSSTLMLPGARSYLRGAWTFLCLGSWWSRARSLHATSKFNAMKIPRNKSWTKTWQSEPWRRDYWPMTVVMSCVLIFVPGLCSSLVCNWKRTVSPKEWLVNRWDILEGAGKEDVEPTVILFLHLDHVVPGRGGGKVLRVLFPGTSSSRIPLPGLVSSFIETRLRDNIWITRKH